MTSPVIQDQPDPTAGQSEQPANQREQPANQPDATVAEIAGLLAAAGTAGATFAAAEAAQAGISAALRGLGLSKVQTRRLIEMDAARPAPPVVPLSPTTRQVFGDGPTYRARYLVNAARRLLGATAVTAGNVVGLPVPGTPLGAALGKEARYFHAHQSAQTQREQAAQRLDAAANSYGPLLGWYSVLDERTTPECVAAHGRNFDPTNPPAIGLPGLKHAGNCRCRPGPPHAGAGLVDQLGTLNHLPHRRTSSPHTHRGPIAASREAAMTVELASKNPSGTTASGMQVKGDGVTYDPKTNSFHATTAAENSSFNAKHPRAAKGGPTGGQFVKAQKQQAAAQKKAAAQQAAAARHQAAAQKKAASAAAAAQRHQAAAAHKAQAAQAKAAKASTHKTSTHKTSTHKASTAKTRSTGKAPSVTAKAMSTPVPGGPSAAALAQALQTLAAQKAAIAKTAATPASQPVHVSSSAVRNPKIPPAVLAAAQAQLGLAAEQAALELSAKTAGYSATHSPLGDPAGPGLWHHKGWQLPAYIQNVAKGIEKTGADESKAIEIAIGKVRDWAEGKGKVSPEVRAAAVKAIAEFEALRAKAHAASLSVTGHAVELAHWTEALHPRDGHGRFAGLRITRTHRTSEADTPISAQMVGYDPANGRKVITGRPGRGTMLRRPVPGSGYTAVDHGPQQFARTFTSYMENNSSTMRAGQTISVHRSHTRIVVTRIAAAAAVAAALTAFGNEAEHMEYDIPPDAGPTSSEMFEFLGKHQPGTLYEQVAQAVANHKVVPETAPPLRTVSRITMAAQGDAIELAAPGKPVTVTLARDWSAMSMQAKAAWVAKLTRQLYG